jgi:superfamily II DNA/RNA helicase
MRFDETGLADEVMQALDAMNFREMTPVQEQTIPVIMEGRDLIACAQTGTGKTAAYVLPLLDKLQREGNPLSQVKSLIIVPTRELAQQIDVQLQGFSYFLPVSTTVVHGSGGGIDWSWQKQGMTSGADIIVATPGRLLAHIDITSGLDFSHIEYFVLDEADRMLDMGFWDDIMKIIEQLPKERQTLMFSATLPPKIREMAKKEMNNPVEVNIAVSRPNEAIDQSAIICYEHQKPGIIRELFETPTGNKTIIFASSKLKVKELAFTLKRMKLNVAAMHSDLDQPKREEVMLDFKNGKIDILVATDVVARGIDIEDIGLVINYEVPREVEDYVHRIGRTARAGAEGAAITLVGEREQGKFRRVEEFLGREITKRPLPEAVGAGPAYTGKGEGDERRGRGGRDSGRGGKGGGKGRGRGEGRRTEEAVSAEGATPAAAHEGEQRPAGQGNRNKRHGRGRGQNPGAPLPEGGQQHTEGHENKGSEPRTENREGNREGRPPRQGGQRQGGERSGENRPNREGQQGQGREGQQASGQGAAQNQPGQPGQPGQGRNRHRGGRNRGRQGRPAAGQGQSSAAHGGQQGTQKPGTKPQQRAGAGRTPAPAPAPQKKSILGKLFSFGRKK